MTTPLRERLQAELEYAAQARAAGKEGRARVCARRAAGWAVGTYRRANAGQVAPPRAALHHLRWLREQPGYPNELRSAAARLTDHVDEDHRLPQPADPLHDAELIVEAFLRLLAANTAEGQTDR